MHYFCTLSMESDDNNVTTLPRSYVFVSVTVCSIKTQMKKINVCGTALVIHYNDVIMSMTASQVTSLTIVYLAVYSGADKRKYQSSASQAFVRGIHRWPVNSPHKGPVMRKMFPFDDVIMYGPINYCTTVGYLMTCVLVNVLSESNHYFKVRHLGRDSDANLSLQPILIYSM